MLFWKKRNIIIVLVLFFFAGLEKAPASTLLLNTPTSRSMLFRWLNEQYFSLQWAYTFLEKKEPQMPTLLNQQINDTFLNHLVYLNFHQNIIQFLMLLNGG